jgi:hypothetical protein
VEWEPESNSGRLVKACAPAFLPPTNVYRVILGILSANEPETFDIAAGVCSDEVGIDIS